MDLRMNNHCPTDRHYLQLLFNQPTFPMLLQVRLGCILEEFPLWVAVSGFYWLVALSVMQLLLSSIVSVVRLCCERNIQDMCDCVGTVCYVPVMCDWVGTVCYVPVVCDCVGTVCYVRHVCDWALSVIYQLCLCVTVRGLSVMHRQCVTEWGLFIWHRCWCRPKIEFIVLVSRTLSPCSTSSHVTQLTTMSGTLWISWILFLTSIS